MSGCCLVLGAGGRVGGFLRNVWSTTTGNAPVLFHQGRPARRIDIAGPLSPELAEAIVDPVASVFVLAGVTPGSKRPLSGNTDCAIAGIALAVRLGARRVFLASSAAVYGRPQTGMPCREDAGAEPRTRYGKAKLAMEKAARERIRELGTSAPQLLCLRMANVVGADQLAGSVRSATPGAPLKLDRFGDGRAPRRAYLSASTLARTVDRLSDPGVRLPWDTLNLADPGAPVAMNDVLEALADAGHPVPWSWRAAPEAALPEMALDTSRLQSLWPDGLRAVPAATLVRDWLTANGGKP